MKIVVALDSFKGGLTAAEACQAVAAGLRAADPAVEIVLKPMADGGEGTAAALMAARAGGVWRKAAVSGPLPGRSVKAGYAWFSEGALAVVEMAAASGLPLLPEHERNPLLTTTSGTGELIKAAVEKGARRMLLAIGGSATVDGGVGAAVALGWRFLDEAGRKVPAGGGHLKEIARIVPPPQRLRTEITVLCDVTNPLCGPLGAAAVFGPQKGATPEMVRLLEDGLLHLAQCIRRELHCDVLNLPGGGAAGGLGAGAVAFCGAQLAPGIATIMEACNLREALRGADWCVTGEGSFDNQSLQGKVVSGVAGLARSAGVPVAVLAGRVKADPAEYRAHGIQAALATHAPDLPMEQVLLQERALLRDTAARWRKSLDG